MVAVVEEQILEIGIEDSGSLFVAPASLTFPQIYRATMQVDWDDAKSRLVSPRPKDWSYLRWYEQIVGAVAIEYQVLLKIRPGTVWSNISPEIRTAIEIADAEAAAEIEVWNTPLSEARRRRAVEAWVHSMRKEDALAQAAQLWEQGRFSDYARLLAPLRGELSPAQLKRLEMAKRRGGVI